MKKEVRSLSIEEIPQTVMDDVILELKNYLVAVFILLPERQQPIRLIGSGTLVEVEGVHHILTAAHVWHETREAKEIGLVITEHQALFTMPRDSINVKELWNGKISEWGPDLALLRLAPQFGSTVAARKSFMNLIQQKELLASCQPASEKELLAVTGMAGEFSEITSHPEEKTVEVHADGKAFFSLLQQKHQRDGYDYLDLGANLKLSGVPSSFIGVSGGGLWQIKLSMAKSGTISWDGKRYFRGVAFWQSAEDSDGRRIIRCHGPKSIFEKAWESWALPRGKDKRDS